MSTPHDDSGNGRTTLTFEDNRQLAVLFGEHDQNLARLEETLGVRVHYRGNVVQIVGPEDARESTRRALEALYRRAQKGGEIGHSEVDDAIRMADATPEQSAAGVRTEKRWIEARSPVQASYVAALQSHELVFGLGPAGTGKTYLAVAIAVSMLRERKVDRIILTRPAVEAGERLGFLPGTLDDKIDPYMRPMLDALYDMMPPEKVTRRRESGEIEMAPLAYMRGRTLANAFIILDEAQNTTPVQMKMFLTRMGENSRMAVTGDSSQVDLPLGSRSGLVDALDVLHGLPGVAIARFSHADVVRHPLVTRIVRAYDGRDRGLLAPGPS